MKALMRVSDANRAEWLEKKKTTIGASEIASVAGLNKYCSPLKLWMEKTGKLEPEPENDAMFIGKHAESLVASVFERKNPDAGAVYPAQILCAHDEYEWATATPDFWLLPFDCEISKNNLWELPGAKILETKMQRSTALQFWENEKIPDSYAFQMLWQMGVTGLQTAYIASLIGGFDFRSVKLDFNPELFQKLIEIASRFRDFVQKDLPPVAGPGDAKLVEGLRGAEARADSIRLQDSEALKLAASWQVAKERKALLQEEMDRWDSEQKFAQNNLLLMMGNAAEARIEGFENGILKKIKITAKEISRAAHEVKASKYTRFDLKVVEE